MERNPINLSTSTNMAWLPLVGLGIVGLAVTISAAQLMSGVSFQAVSMPLFVMTGMGLFVSVLLGVMTWFNINYQKSRIRSLIDNAWASWAQYEDEMAWQTARDKLYQQGEAFARVSISSLIVLAVIGAIVIGFLNFYFFPLYSRIIQPGDAVMVNVIVGVVFALLTVVVFFSALGRRNRLEQTHKLHQKIRMPYVYIGKYGVYRDDDGYHPFGTLTGVKLEEGVLKFDVRYSTYDNGRMHRHSGTIRVLTPRASMPDAEMLVDRFKREVLK